MNADSLIDVNNRPIPFPENIDEEKVPNETLTERVINVSLPFFQMIPPIAPFVTFFDGSRKILPLLERIGLNSFFGEDELVDKYLIQLVIVTSTIALSLLYPLACLYYSYSVQIVTEFSSLVRFVQKGKYSEAGKTIARIMYSLLHLMSGTYATRELLAISLLSKAATEFYQASKEYSKKRYLETFANLLLAFIRAREAVPQLQTAFEDFYKPTFSQEELDELLQVPTHSSFFVEAKKRKSPVQMTMEDFINFQIINSGNNQLDLSKYIAKRGLSRTISNLSFEEMDDLNLKIDSLNFDNCNFKESVLSGSVVTNSVFTKTDFTSASILSSHFSNTKFIGSDFTDVYWNWTFFSNVTWTGCNLSQSSFNNTDLLNVIFKQCSLIETCFFDAKVMMSSITNSNLTDCLFFETKQAFKITGSSHQITRPIIGIPWNFDLVGMHTESIKDAIRDNNAIPFKFDYELKNISSYSLEDEVRLILRLPQIINHGNESIIQKILRNPYGGTTIPKIKAFTERVAPYMHGLVIPGGHDLHPELYGSSREDRTHTDENFLHTMVEAGLIDQAHKLQIPTLGICRGSQIINVFFGGTLKQHVDDHMRRYHNLTIVDSTPTSEPVRIAREILGGDHIVGISMHHQASQKIGNGLQVVLQHADVPKLIVSEDGNFVLSQIHPEIYLMPQINSLDQYKNNQNFFRHLTQRAIKRIKLENGDDQSSPLFITRLTNIRGRTQSMTA